MYDTQLDRDSILDTEDHASLDANFNIKLTDKQHPGLDRKNLPGGEYHSDAEVTGVAATERLTRGIYKTAHRYMAMPRC